MSGPARIATPALHSLNVAGVWHQVYTYQHGSTDKGFGIEAAEKLGIPSQHLYKTLLVETSDGELANAVVAAADMLNLKRVATALGTKRVAMADPHHAQQKTGYVIGGISPLGQKTNLPLVVDVSVVNHETMWVSGGRRGVSVELRVQDFLTLTAAIVAHISR